MKYDDKLKLIEEYILGRLSAEEKLKFEQELRLDKELAEVFDAKRIEWEIQELLAENELRKQISAEFAMAAQTPIPNKKPNTNLWWIAGLLGICTLVYFIFPKSEKAKEDVIEQKTEEVVPASQAPKAIDTIVIQENLEEESSTPQKQKSVEFAQVDRKAQLRNLALSSYASPANLIDTRGALGDTILLAQEEFEKKNFLKVLNLLKDMPLSEEQEILSLRAHSNFGAKKYSMAAKDFKSLEKGGIYKKEAEWYGLLATMASGEISDRFLNENLLSISVDMKHPFHKEALALMEKIK